MKEEKHLEICGGLREDIGYEKGFARPNGLREKAETAISCRGPGPTRKKKDIYQWSGGGRRGCKYVPVWDNNRVELTQ